MLEVVEVQPHILTTQLDMQFWDKAKFSNKAKARSKTNRRPSLAHAGLGQQRKRLILHAVSAVSSDFDPLDLAGDGLELWLDASKITGMDDGDTFASGAGNCEWTDQSGNSVGQTSPGAHGLGAKYKTNIINGLPAILFAQPADPITTGSCVSSTLSGNTFKEADYTVFVVMQPVDVDHATESGQHIFGVYSDTDWTSASTNNKNRITMGILDSDAKFVVQGYSTTADRTSSTSALVNGTPYILTAAYDYSATTMWNIVDGTVQEKDTSFTTPTAGVGAGSLFMGSLGGGRGSTAVEYDGHIAEVLVFSSLLSEKNLNQVKHYLADKYNIAVPPKTRY